MCGEGDVIRERHQGRGEGGGLLEAKGKITRLGAACQRGVLRIRSMA